MTRAQINRATVLGRVMSHPLRLEFLRQTRDRQGKGLTATQFARSAGEGISTVNYHINKMRKLDAIESREDLRRSRAPIYDLTPLGREVIATVEGLKNNNL